jgi:hypothetical protein
MKPSGLLRRERREICQNISWNVRGAWHDATPAKSKALLSAEPKGAAKGSKEGEGDSSPTHGLPSFVLLTRDGHQVANDDTQPWPEGFSELDGGLVRTLARTALSTKSTTTTPTT